MRTRILITLGFAAMYRFGSFVVLPGVNPEALSALREQTSTGLMSLLNMFSGGAFSNASIFALGIMPYISASIVIQLFAFVVPYFQKMQREGESGRRKMNQYTRYLTILILLFQAPGYLVYTFKGLAVGALQVDWTLFLISSTIILAAGSMFILWLGERITDKGIGNGVSLIIMLGIIARLPQAFSQEFVNRLNNLNGGGMIMFAIELILLLVVICAAILLVQGTRKIPVQYAKRMMGGQQVGGVRQYIPLKVFAANVMPIIFAQAIMFIPITLLNMVAGGEHPSAVLIMLSDHTSVAYNVVFALLIVAFTYFYTAITLNPTQMAEDMKRNNGFIPGVRPGRDTAEFIDQIMSHTMGFAQFFGGTSLLILVGVVLDTLQQIESHLLMRHYDGLLSSGRIHGRNGMS